MTNWAITHSFSGIVSVHHQAPSSSTASLIFGTSPTTIPRPLPASLLFSLGTRHHSGMVHLRQRLPPRQRHKRQPRLPPRRLVRQPHHGLPPRSRNAPLGFRRLHQPRAIFRRLEHAVEPVRQHEHCTASEQLRAIPELHRHQFHLGRDVAVWLVQGGHPKCSACASGSLPSPIGQTVVRPLSPFRLWQCILEVAPSLVEWQAKGMAGQEGTALKFWSQVWISSITCTICLVGP